MPDRLFELTNDPDPARAAAATKAMLGMRKIVIAELEEAGRERVRRRRLASSARQPGDPLDRRIADRLDLGGVVAHRHHQRRLGHDRDQDA